MANAAQMNPGRAKVAALIVAAGLTCSIGDGDVPEFDDPENPPAVDPDDTALRGTLLTNGLKSNPTMQYLVPAAPGAGAVLYEGEEYTISVDPTARLLCTFTYGVSDAVGEWREILIELDGATYKKIHPVGTSAGWQAKTNQEERPVRLLLEF